jgi:hypothetical protein
MTEKRLRELLMMWEEDSLSPQEAEELSERLESSPEARREIVEHFMVTNQVFLHFKAEAAEEAPAGAGSDTRQIAKRRRARRRKRPLLSGRPRSAWSRWGSWAALAAGILLALGTYFVSQRRSWQPEPSGLGKAEEEAPAPVAMVASLPLGHLSATSGRVEIRHGMEGSWSLVGNGVGVRPADSLRTHDSRTTVEFDSGGWLCLDAHTTLSFASGTTRTGVSVVSGTVYVDTADGMNVLVQTPHGSFQDLGTRFGVEVSPEHSRLTVLEGEVRASNVAGSVTVGAGYQARILESVEPKEAVEIAPDAEARFAWAMGRAPAVASRRDETQAPAYVPAKPMLLTVDLGSKWSYDGSREEAKRASYDGRDGVWQTHPRSENVPFRWLGTAVLAEGYAHFLELDVNTHPSAPQDATDTSDWVLVVMADGEELLRETIRGRGWRTVRADLTRFAGQEVALELWNMAGGRYLWRNEYGYWGEVRLLAEPENRTEEAQ